MYSHLPPLNIRVYGIRIIDKKVMLIKEYFQNQPLIKFPGGGLEYGEGTIECLKREFKEELNVEIPHLEHYYTTDFFQKSAWDDRQVISIYYLVDLPVPYPTAFENETGQFFMADQKQLLELVQLPIDKVVIKKLIKDDLI